MQYWYNVRTGQVVEQEETKDMADLMGPYASAAEAQNALAAAAERTRAWDEEDRRDAEGD